MVECFMTTPFTYLIGWPELNTYYYGSRYRAGCHPSDLWTKYFTSGKKVWAFRELHGDPTLIQIRRTFKTKDQAVDWEHKVLKRLDAARRPDFLNGTNGKAPSMQGRNHRHESKEKSRISNTGLKRSDKAVKNNSAAQLKRIAAGYSDSEATRLKKRLSHLNVPKTEECKKKLAAVRLGKFTFTNGIDERLGTECPEGWWRGRKPQKTKKETEVSF